MENQENYEINKSVYIKGLGTATILGDLDLEKFIKSLLKSKYVNG